MKNFRRIKSLKNILRGLKSNVGLFMGTIYLFNPKHYVSHTHARYISKTKSLNTTTQYILVKITTQYIILKIQYYY